MPQEIADKTVTNYLTYLCHLGAKPKIQPIEHFAGKENNYAITKRITSWYGYTPVSLLKTVNQQETQAPDLFYTVKECANPSYDNFHQISADLFESSRSHWYSFIKDLLETMEYRQQTGTLDKEVQLKLEDLILQFTLEGINCFLPNGLLLPNFIEIIKVLNLPKEDAINLINRFSYTFFCWQAVQYCNKTNGLGQQDVLQARQQLNRVVLSNNKCVFPARTTFNEKNKYSSMFNNKYVPFLYKWQQFNYTDLSYSPNKPPAIKCFRELIDDITSINNRIIPSNKKTLGLVMKK